MNAWPLILLCVVIEIALELCYKVAANRASGIDDHFLTALKQPLAWLGMALWLAETLIWVRVLETTALSVAYPIMSLVYLGIPLASAWVLKERLSLRHALASGLIASGVALIALAGTTA